MNHPEPTKPWRIVKRTPLEKALSRLDTPEQGKDLAARCLATIPETPERSTPGRRWLPAAGLKHLVIATVVVAAVGFWTTQPMWSEKGTTRSASTAFAETIQAMRQVDHYHMSMRNTSSSLIDFNLWLSAQQPLKLTLEKWFDTRRGYCVVGYTRLSRNLVLPDDTVLEWRQPLSSNSGKPKSNQATASTVLEGGTKRTREPGRWEREQRDSEKTILQPLENLAANCDIVRSEKGKRNGREVTTYILLDRKKRHLTDRGRTKIETFSKYFTVVTDNISGRLLLLRLAFESHGVWRTSAEWEWDYTPLGNASVFDPLFFPATNGTSGPEKKTAPTGP